MLKFLVTILLGLWFFAIFARQSFDGYIHLLLVGAVVAICIQYFTENKLID